MLVAGAVSAQEMVVKIGVASPLTGGGAAYGKDIENGESARARILCSSAASMRRRP